MSSAIPWKSKRHRKNRIIQKSGQIIIFHQPRFPWNKGISLTKPPFGVRSCEVAIIWPEKWFTRSLCLPWGYRFYSQMLGSIPKNHFVWTLGLRRAPWICIKQGFFWCSKLPLLRFLGMDHFTTVILDGSKMDTAEFGEMAEDKYSHGALWVLHFLLVQYLRIFQQAPGTYPRSRTNSLARNSFHLGVWGRVCSRGMFGFS